MVPAPPHVAPVPGSVSHAVPPAAGPGLPSRQPLLYLAPDWLEQALCILASWPCPQDWSKSVQTQGQQREPKDGALQVRSSPDSVHV